MGARSIPPPPRVVRRALRAVWPLVVVVLTGLAVPVVVAGACLVVLDRRARLFRVSVLAVLVLWVDVRLLLRCRDIARRLPDASDPAWRETHEELLSDALDSLVFYARRWLGLEIELTDRMHFGSEDEPLVALARHAGPFDSLAVAWLLARTAGRLPRIVLAEAMRWDPGIDTILSRLDSSFVPSGGDRLAGVRTMAATLGKDDVFLLFPEGQNWTPGRRLRVIERLRAKGDGERAERAERLRNVLPPKARGAWEARAARPGADVMVVAHAGFGDLSTARLVWEAVPFHGRDFRVRTWTYPAQDVPDEPEAFGHWLDERWSEVDDWVAARRAERERGTSDPGGDVPAP
ncbi:1-acyl-sn-glycerol-3-phosphate acyltransferase [Phycicoccus sp. BSK3Z-2]|uniref:1-acyl-sn-glycerol-3-phosphate acyltransferase n=1 Tax=Phycicoccus avicenniae TaxID=2828860 RepID=A0A941HZM8_9MICO|nr:1-acyl-sn-glycerol-3-phosphate acyltransferase [Phycicoccus avicenniae]MBR7744263.1 1-acyl-sn-glycerol-3-phosphate acyltransferase [Phycicoccus avicenniae]